MLGRETRASCSTRTCMRAPMSMKPRSQVDSHTSHGSMQSHIAAATPRHAHSLAHAAATPCLLPSLLHQAAILLGAGTLFCSLEASSSSSSGGGLRSAQRHAHKHMHSRSSTGNRSKFVCTHPHACNLLKDLGDAIQCIPNQHILTPGCRKSASSGV